MEVFSSQLRFRLSLLYDHRNGFTPVNYHILDLNELTNKLHTCMEHGTSAGGQFQSSKYSTSQLLYSTLLLRKSILTTFHVFCLSEELNKDANIPYHYCECEKICKVVDEFNSLLSGYKSTQSFLSRRTSWYLRPSLHGKRDVSGLGYCIALADLMEIYTEAGVERITAALNKDCSIKNVLQIAKFEGSLLMALTGIVATFTSLLTTENKKKLVFVSNETFVLQSKTDSTVHDWMDCLIPEAQSDILSSVQRDSLCRLWSKVAESLLAQSHPSFGRSRTLKELLPQLSMSAIQTDLECYPYVGSCFRYVASKVLQVECLAEWDDALRHLLVSYLTAYRKGVRRPKPELYDTVTVLESKVFVAFDKHSSQQMKQLQGSMDNAKSILVHTEVMKQSMPLCAFLGGVTTHIALSLLQSLGRTMFYWNLAALCRLVTSELPLLLETIKRYVAMMLYVATPRVSFPANSRFHSLECRSRDVCAALHTIVTFLQSMIEDFYKLFQLKWTEQCSKMMELHFPSPKSLRNTQRRHQSRPSDYCEVIIKNLFLPLMKAAALLSEEQQRNIFYLLLSVFFNVLRKTITSNKALFVRCIGQQLLVDYHYLQKWLTSEDRELNESVCQLLSTLPVTADLEKGLLRICNAGDPSDGQEDTDNATQSMAELNISLLRKHFPIFMEIAWNSDKDWLKP